MEVPVPRRPFRRHHQVAILLVVALVGAYAFWARGDRSAPPARQAATTAPAGLPSTAPGPAGPAPTATPAGEEPSPAATAPTEPYDIAHAKVEEDRGEPMGLAARVSVPPELQHYSDRRRFLAVQIADSREEQYDIPQDDADLVAMFRAGKLVPMPALSEDCILYDIGVDAADDPMVHYDPRTGRDVPLYASAAELDAALAALSERAPHARTRREQAAVAKARQRMAPYEDPAPREELLQKGAEVAALAGSFNGASYDLSDPADRARFDSSLLSLTRPWTRDVILDLAREYYQKFGRQLPITSLIRTERYQRKLGRVNANATHVEVPPHTTGAAFDISYRYMAAVEQQFLMDRIAALEDEGKVEALKERRNHFHVFVFGDGRRPPDNLVAQFLDDVDASRAAQRAERSAARRSARRGARAR